MRKEKGKMNRDAKHARSSIEKPYNSCYVYFRFLIVVVNFKTASVYIASIRRHKKSSRYISQLFKKYTPYENELLKNQYSLLDFNSDYSLFNSEYLSNNWIIHYHSPIVFNE